MREIVERCDSKKNHVGPYGKKSLGSYGGRRQRERCKHAWCLFGRRAGGRTSSTSSLEPLSRHSLRSDVLSSIKNLSLPPSRQRTRTFDLPLLLIKSPYIAHCLSCSRLSRFHREKDRCPANLQQTSQPRPDSGPGLSVVQFESL